MKGHVLFQNQPADDPKNFSIRLLSYNIFLRPPPVKNNASDYKDARCEEFIKYINDYDILCLQEIFGFLNKRKQKLVKACFKSGFYFHASSRDPSFFSTFLIDGGIMTLSKFPIVASEFQAYKYCILTDSLSEKGCLYTKILVKDQVLHLFNTHFQASYIGKASDRKASVNTRIDQFHEMRRFMEIMLKKYNFEGNDLALIAGDFNVNARNSIHPIEFVSHLGLEHLKTKELYNEYEYVLDALSGTKCEKDKIIDILKSQTGEPRPSTYAVVTTNEKGENIPMETALTNQEDLLSDQSIDYILHLIPKGVYDGFDTIPSRSSSLQVVYSSIKVEKFLVENLPFTQLSDHYGLSLKLVYKSGGEESNVNENEATNYPINQNLNISQSNIDGSVILNISHHEI